MSSSQNTPITTIPQGQGPVVLLVNNTHVGIDYNIKKAGPSGVSKVEVYATKDRGKTWLCLAVDSELHSPVAVNLPDEGVYGIRMVGINGNGFGGKKPGPGDRPTTVIEVDLTKPIIVGWKVTPGKNGNLVIHWKASDKNLDPLPVNLYYRTKANTPWKVMAQKIKNDGTFLWPVRTDLAPQYFVRLEVTDRAGNRATCETTTPIFVDRTEPDINVQGVTVIQTRVDEPVNLVPVEPEN
jgi:hypothetical protein